MALIEYQIKDRIGYITLNRPEKMNAITHEMLEDLFKALEDIKTNPDVWVGIITGEGKAFCAGHDLAQKVNVIGNGPTIPGLFTLMNSIKKPLISAVNGFCMAQGCLIALSTDIQIASEAASFGWPNTKRGITSVGGTAMLPHKIPYNKACEFLFTGDFISAQDALHMNLINKVVPADQLMEKTQELAYKILENAPLAVSGMKEAAKMAKSLKYEDAISYSALVFDRVQKTEDAQEGSLAFKEKRQPVWKGC